MKKQIAVMVLVILLAAFAGAGTKAAVTHFKNQSSAEDTVTLQDETVPLGEYGETSAELQEQEEAAIAEAIINGEYVAEVEETGNDNVGVAVTESGTASVPQVEYFSQDELFSTVPEVSGDKVITGGTVYTYDESQKSYYAASETDESVSFVTADAAVYANGEGHIRTTAIGGLDSSEFQMNADGSVSFAQVEHYDAHGNITDLFYYSTQNAAAEYAVFAWVYDENGNPTDVTVTVRTASDPTTMTGVASAVNTYLCENTLDNDGKLSAVTLRTGSGSVVANLQYFYGADGQTTRYLSGVSADILPVLPDFDAVVTWDENGDLLSAGNFTTLTVYEYASAADYQTEETETLTQGAWVLDLESAGYADWFGRFTSVDQGFAKGHILLCLNSTDILTYRGANEVYTVVRDAENPGVFYFFAPGTADTTDTSKAKMTVTYNADTDMLDVVSGSSTYSLRRW